MTVVARRSWTSALADFLASDTGVPVGRNRAPVTDDARYYVLWSIPGGGLSGPPLADPHADAALVYQVDSVGVRDDQVEWLADLAREAMLERAKAGVVPMPGWGVMGVWPDGAVGAPDGEGEVLSAAERFVVKVTPTGGA